MTTPAATRGRAVVEHASAPLLAAGTRSAELTLEGGRNTLVFYRRDPAECERRLTRHTAALRIDDLVTLLQLPAGIPVPLASLPQPLRHRVDRLPHGAVTVEGVTVYRQAVRPLSVDLVVVRTPPARWDDGLARASRFTPFARRALLVAPPADQREDLLMQAAYYGIGILEPTPDGATWTLPPEPYRPRHHTPAAWNFAEQLHARLP